jgi:hypothetical protein
MQREQVSDDHLELNALKNVKLKMATFAMIVGNSKDCMRYNILSNNSGAVESHFWSMDIKVIKFFFQMGKISK